MNLVSVRSQTANVRALLESVRAEFPRSATTRRVTLDALACCDELDGDPSLLRRLLMSLVDHAARRAPDGTRVALVVWPRHAYTEFRIADEGSRLAPATRPRVLAPSSDGLPEREFGLTYCQLVTEAQGGTFRVAETPTGAVVCLALPTAAADGRPHFRAKSGVQLRTGRVGPDTTPQTILVVDDEPLVRTFVSRVLKDKGYAVIEADRAERAMDHLMLRRQPLALLLSDVGLPGASGADLARQATLLNPRLPTLLMSATPKDSLVQEGVLKTGTYLLQKPFSVADLIAKVDDLVPGRVPELLVST